MLDEHKHRKRLSAFERIQRSMKDRIIVQKSGIITGIGRYTEMPFVAESLAEYNMMFPDDAKRKIFFCNRSTLIPKGKSMFDNVNLGKL